MNAISTTLYCCRRYDMAPLRTYSAISRIRGVPSSARIMPRKKYQANRSASTAAAGTNQKIGSICPIALFS